jgi:hypothetical protein
MSTRDAMWRLMSVYPWQPSLTSPQGFSTHPHYTHSDAGGEFQIASSPIQNTVM